MNNPEFGMQNNRRFRLTLPDLPGNWQELRISAEHAAIYNEILDGMTCYAAAKKYYRTQQSVWQSCCRIREKVKAGGCS